MKFKDEDRLVRVCPVSDLKDGESRFVSVLSKSAAVFKVAGKVYAIEGRCKHKKTSLAHDGDAVRGNVARCRSHGWKYDIPTGKCLTNEYSDLCTYRVLIQKGTIFLDRQEIWDSGTNGPL
ncbi:Rieske (2Fe-2S) protein [candidate division KSB1 bacterium]